MEAQPARRRRQGADEGLQGCRVVGPDLPQRDRRDAGRLRGREQVDRRDQNGGHRCVSRSKNRWRKCSPGSPHESFGVLIRRLKSPEAFWRAAGHAADGGVARAALATSQDLIQTRRLPRRRACVAVDPLRQCRDPSERTPAPDRRQAGGAGLARLRRAAGAGGTARAPGAQERTARPRLAGHGGRGEQPAVAGQSVAQAARPAGDQHDSRPRVSLHCDGR